MRTFFTFLLTVLLITGFGGCYRCGKELPYVDINQMHLSAGYKELDRYLLIQVNDPIKYDSLILYTTFSGSFYSKIKKASSSNFLSSAIASEDCDQFLGLYGSKETIESINVITLNNFDTEFTGGDTINTIIKIAKDNSDSTQSLNQFLANIQPGINANISGGNLRFTLTRKPTEKVVQFRVAVNLTNGEKYSGETIPITIKQ